MGPAVPSPGLTLEALTVDGGYVWVGNAYRTDEDGQAIQGSDVSPIKIAGSAGVRLRVSESLYFAPLASLHYGEYLRAEGRKSVPTQIETGAEVGDVAGLLTVLVSAPWLYPLDLGESWELRLGGGPTLNFRIPVNPIAGSAGPVVGHFYTAGRFISPEAWIGGSYAFRENMRIGATARTVIPIHNFWDDYPVPFWDEMQVLLSARIEIAVGAGRRSSSDEVE